MNNTRVLYICEICNFQADIFQIHCGLSMERAVLLHDDVVPYQEEEVIYTCDACGSYAPEEGECCHEEMQAITLPRGPVVYNEPVAAKQLPPSTKAPVKTQGPKTRSKKVGNIRRPTPVYKRLGKKDIQFLKRLAQKLKDIEVEMEMLNDFIDRKLEDDVDGRLERRNIGSESLIDLKKANDLLMANLVEVQLPNCVLHVVPQEVVDATYGLRLLNGRLYVKVGTTEYAATTLVYFFNPRLCNMPGCQARHPTVFDFVSSHPNFSTKDIDLSHLFHECEDFNVQNLQMELGKWNYARNKCRNRCVCGLWPACFTNSF